MTTDRVENIEETGMTPLAGGMFFRQVLGQPFGKSIAVPPVRRQSEKKNEPKSEAELAPESGNRILKYAHMMLTCAGKVIVLQDKRISRLQDMATVDELTGLKNRRGFFEAFTGELDRCDRDISAGGLLVLIELDNLHTIYDTHGKMAGDACLRLMARALKDETRPMDTAARLAPDEFVLLFSNASKREAANRAQDLAWRLNHLVLAWHGEEISVQASLGLKNYRKGDKAQKIFNDADVQLYVRRHVRSENEEVSSVRA